MRNLYTISDIDNTRVFELDNRTYNTIHGKFANIVGDKRADKLMWKRRNKTLRDLSCNSFVDIISCIQLMG